MQTRRWIVYIALVGLCGIGAAEAVPQWIESSRLAVPIARAVRVTEPPSRIPAPFYGRYSGESRKFAATSSWFDVPGSPLHRAFATFDDTNAYDLNLADNLDRGIPVLAPAAGKVIPWGRSFPGTVGGGPLGAVMIDHGNWASGMMHMRDVRVKTGDTILGGQVIGFVSSAGALTAHLHFAAYAKEQESGRVIRLLSRRVGFTQRGFLSSEPPSVEHHIRRSRLAALLQPLALRPRYRGCNNRRVQQGALPMQTSHGHPLGAARHHPVHSPGVHHT
jgi:murein DD-endopeptidase MepM/ murein hydrolase activator NlpD